MDNHLAKAVQKQEGYCGALKSMNESVMLWCSVFKVLFKSWEGCDVESQDG